LFASLAMLVYFADHLAHSIQIDAIMRVVERNTLAVIETDCSVAARRPSRCRSAPLRSWPIACKAMSPVINDPYTAVQAIGHLSVIFCTLATRPLGAHLARDGEGVVRVIVPGRRFGEYLAVMCGLVRRYGAREPTVVEALLRLLGNCAALTQADDERTAAVEEQAALLLAAAERSIASLADLAGVRQQADQVLDE
jgi:uncharacterized membrane protein